MPRGRPKKTTPLKVKLNLTVDPALKSRLESVSEREEKSQSQIVEEAVTVHLDKLEEGKP